MQYALADAGSGRPQVLLVEVEGRQDAAADVPPLPTGEPKIDRRARQPVNALAIDIRPPSPIPRHVLQASVSQAEDMRCIGAVRFATTTRGAARRAAHRQDQETVVRLDRNKRCGL